MVKKSENSKIFKEQFNSIFVNSAVKGEFLPKEYVLSSNYSYSYLIRNNWWLN